MRSTRQTRMICRKPFSLVDLASAFALPELGLARWEVLPGPDHGRAPRAASSERLPSPILARARRRWKTG